jgi:predicted nuclease of predicted toxin-antitoxin system
MRFFIDQNVPESVASLLIARGYEVVRLRERIPTESPDALVAAVSETNGAILVTFDPDFKALASRIGIGRRRFATL